MLGITFKENCPDVRNTRIVDVVKALEEYNINVTIYDPYASPKEVMQEYGLDCLYELPNKTFDSIVLGVAHEEFLNLDFTLLQNKTSLLYDVKGMLKNSSSHRL